MTQTVQRRQVLALGAGLLCGACAPAQPATGAAAAGPQPKPAPDPAATSAPAPTPASTMAAAQPANGGSAPQPAAASAASKDPMQNQVVVDVWHDLVCPWCRIGCHQLHQAIDQLARSAPERTIAVRYHAFLLEPSTPPEGYDLRERLASKYGAARLEQMFATVTQRGAQSGLHFDFSKIRRSPATVPGHALIASTPPAQQRALLTALHVSYFEHGANLGDAAVLTEAALAAQLDPGVVADALADKALHDQVRAEAQAGSRMGIDGVPHFRIAGQVLHGAQPVSALVAALQLAGGAGR